MKRFIILTLVLGLIFCGATVFAMGNKGQEKREGVQTQGPTSAQSEGIQSQDVEKWKGKEVKALNGEKLGTIKNFAKNKQGQSQFAVVSVSGKERAVPIEALTPSTDGKHLTLNMTRDQMKDAPEFSQKSLADSSYTDQLYRYYGVQPGWSGQSSGRGETIPGATPGGSSSPGAGSYGTPGPTGTPGGSSPYSSGSTGSSQGTMAPVVQAVDKGKTDSGYTTSPRTGTDVNRDRDMSRDREVNREKNMNRDQSEMRKDWYQAHQTSKLTGAEVRNKQGEDLGKIKDFVIDSRGRIQYALLAEGGVMGVGGKMFAVPFEALSYNPKDAKDHYFTLNMSKDQLAKAPVFDETHFSDRTWNERVYRYFGVQSRWPNEEMPMDKGAESGTHYRTQPSTSKTK